MSLKLQVMNITSRFDSFIQYEVILLSLILSEKIINNFEVQFLAQFEVVFDVPQIILFLRWRIHPRIMHILQAVLTFGRPFPLIT